MSTSPNYRGTSWRKSFLDNLLGCVFIHGEDLRTSCGSFYAYACESLVLVIHMEMNTSNSPNYRGNSWRKSFLDSLLGCVLIHGEDLHISRKNPVF